MIPNLSIRQLQTFREIMRSGSVTNASRALGRTQPSVSAMLASLEAELGFDLFERHKGRLIPRPEAHFFFEETQEILDRVNRSAQTMREIGDLERGRLKIACYPGGSLFMLPQIVANFVQDRLDVDVSMMTRTSAKVREWIASQQYDVGIAEMPGQRKTVNLHPINLERVCALRKDDPLTEKEVLTPDDLDNAPMASLFREHFTYQDAARVFGEADRRFRMRFEISVFVPGLTLVEQGVAYALVDQITAASYRLYRGAQGVLTFRPFRPLLSYDIAVLTPAHRPASRLAAAFCERIEPEVRRFIGQPSAAE
jgi:DNA-binding transcriptional LysR family regulator